MKKYEINGKEKEDGGCTTCKDGEVFNIQERRTQKYQDKFNRNICAVCNTLYKLPREEAEKLIEENCSGCPFNNGEECTNEAKEYICFGNLDKFRNKIDKEADKMVEELDLMSDRLEFNEKGVCPNHHWIKSMPMATSEGKFVFDSCIVCKLGRINYKGKTYEDYLPKLVNFIAHKGIENEKTTFKKKEELNFDVPKVEDLSEMFTNEEDLGFV